MNFCTLWQQKIKLQEKVNSKNSKPKSKVVSGKRRISELDMIISHIYEDNILGKLSDERYVAVAKVN